jgi:hypothetical protein
MAGGGWSGVNWTVYDVMAGAEQTIMWKDDRKMHFCSESE